MNATSCYEQNYLKSFVNYNSILDIIRQHADSRGSDLAYIFLRDGEVKDVELTFQEIDTKAKTIAAYLQSINACGKNVLLFYPYSPEFILAFLGCLYAGAVAVPAFVPNFKKLRLDRLINIIENSDGFAVLTDANNYSAICEWKSSFSQMQHMEIVVTDVLSNVSLAGNWIPPTINQQTLLFIQYTSGSTSNPKGVMVTHGNILHNEQMIRESFSNDDHTSVVGWLPFYHDMGLVGNILQPLCLGRRSILMSPSSFLQKPFRWLKAISDYRATTSGGPNFAYDLCVKHVTEAQKSLLDLSSWKTAFNGSEQVKVETLRSFSEAFSSCGFNKDSFYPCYGLAEATLFVSGRRRPFPLSVFSADKKHLTQGVIQKNDSGDLNVSNIVSVGEVWSGLEVQIVNPRTKKIAPKNSIGEIWIAGESVAKGYWKQKNLSLETFCSEMKGESSGKKYLRTGDLGFMYQDQLYITGRLKELIIIRGKNYYPQDIEVSVQQADSSLIKNCGAVFSVLINSEEKIVILQEVDRVQLKKIDPIVVFNKVKQFIAMSYDLSIHEILLLKPGSILKTTSGKVQRNLCKKQYLAGKFRPLFSPYNSSLTEGAWKNKELDDESDKKDIRATLMSIITKTLDMKAEDFDIHSPLNTMGIDSIMVANIVNEIKSSLNVDIKPEDIFEGITLEAMVTTIQAQSFDSLKDQQKGNNQAIVEVEIS